MARFAKIFGIGFAALVVLIGVGAFFFQWNWVRGWAGEQAGGALGRSILVEGDLDVDLFSRTPGLRAERVKVANADWGSEPAMVELGRVEFRVRLRDLLKGRLTFTELHLTEPKVLLEKNDEGKANWEFGDRPGAAVANEVAIPSERDSFPIIEKLVIERGRFVYKDPQGGIDVDSEVNTAIGTGKAEDALKLAGTGKIKEKPFKLDARAGSLLTLRDEDARYPIDLKMSVGETRASIEGTMAKPLEFDGIDVDLKISGADMAELFPVIGVPLPPSGRYSLEGHLRRHGDKWAFHKFKGIVGKSDLAGDVAFDFGRKRPFMDATLVSRRLDYNDLAGFIGSDPDEKEGKAPAGRVLPHTEVNLTKLRAMDMRVNFSGRQILAPGAPLEDLKAILVIADGRATLKPISVGVAGGTVKGTIVLDGRKKVPAAQLDLDISRIELSQFFKGGAFADKMKGILGGHVELSGVGSSTAEILGSSDGRLALVMGDGTFSNLLLELIGIDIAEALGLLIDEDKPIRMRCTVADFVVQKGNAQVKTFVIDTTDTAISGTGMIDLGKEAMKLKLKAHPKDPSIFAARTPIDIGGTFADPSFGIDPKEAAVRGGIAAALSALLTPLAALLPFIELGLGQDSPCESMIQQALR